MDFDNFCSFFECHSILAEKQRTKQTNYSSLSLSASLDTQDTLQGGIIVEWNNFWQEIPVWQAQWIINCEAVWFDLEKLSFVSWMHFFVRN